MNAEQDFYKQVTQPGIKGGSRPRSEESFSLPERVGNYRIEGSLGRGGMSFLYLAIHPETHEPVVVKVLPAHFLSHPEMKNRFHNEAEIISMADHPNIVKLYDHGEWADGLFIAMEFIRGISLRQFILQHSMSLRRSLGVVIQIAGALEHLHTHGVIHRDLKPENVLLTADGGVKVIDFGIAQLHPEPHKVESGQRQVMGTPVYMSPEQKENPFQVSFASDIYSLGIICYELVLGRLSHGTIHLSLMPRGLQKILAKALQPDPKNRYQQVKEFRHDLEIYLDSELIKRDQTGREYARDLADNLRRAQDKLLPRRSPSWNKVAIGIACSEDLSLSGIYYDFLELEQGRYGILMSEPAAKGVEALLHTALFQGMVQALSPNSGPPEELIGKLNRRLISHRLDEAFTLSYLILEPTTNDLLYLSCGFGPLFLGRPGSGHVEKLSSDHIAVGITPHHEFVPIRTRWRVGDVALLSTWRAMGTESSALEEAFRENLLLQPQQQAESILRRLPQPKVLSPERRPLVILTIQRIA